MYCPWASRQVVLKVKYILNEFTLDMLVNCVVNWLSLYDNLCTFSAGADPDCVLQDNTNTICAVLEEQKHKKQTAPVPISGPELAALMKIGTRVVRGLDWKWGDQVRLCTCLVMSAEINHGIRYQGHAVSLIMYSMLRLELIL